MTTALILLCGGQSTRMGCDKAFLPFGTESLLNYQIRRFRPYFEKIYLSVPKHGNRPADSALPNGCPAIRDTISGIGPMGGLLACMEAVPEEILFFTSVDAPFTDPKLAVTLCEKLMEKAPDGYRICSVGQPLFAAYSKKCLPDIRKCVKEKNYRLRQLFHPSHTWIPEAFLPDESFFNMNTPAAYYEALARLAKQNPTAFPANFAIYKKRIPVISFTARSGTGKTTYLEKLLPLFVARGLRVAVIKHDAHGFEIDKPGKDSYRLTHAGAAHMILTSTDQTAAIFTHPGQSQELESLIGRIENVDLILTEGYKQENYPKIHLLRKGYQETPVGNLSNTIAYVADFPYRADAPVFDLNRPEDLVGFLLESANIETP